MSEKNSFPGRIVAIVLMVFGIGIFAALTSFVVARLVGLQVDQEEMIEIVREENALLRAEFAELKELLKQ